MTHTVTGLRSEQKFQMRELVGGISLILAILILFVGYIFEPLYENWAMVSLILGFGLLIGGIILTGIRRSEEDSHSFDLSPTAPLVDEWICEQGREEEEVSHCEMYLVPNEKLLAIIAARGESELNRLTLTDKRIVFYPRGRFQSGVSFDYKQIDTVQGKKRLFLTHLGDINLSAKGKIIRFEKVGIEYINQIVGTISRMKQKAIVKPTRVSTPQTVMRRFCTNCGTIVKPEDMFCGNCGVKLK